MRILIEPSDYVLRNIGDMGMLQASVRRLRSLWNNAVIQIPTRDAEALRRLCPEAEPFDAAGRAHWLSLNHPAVKSPMKQLRMWAKICLRPSMRSELAAFTTAVSTADLLVVTGMGGVTDAFPEYARDLLHSVAFTIKRGKYVAMVGQGIGPLTRPDLVHLARTVLPSVNLIALRENLASEPLLLSLGVNCDRIITTGDDAIETAYRLRNDQPGNYLGVNVRVADYSGVELSYLPRLRSTLVRLETKLETNMLAIPISSVPGESDHESIARLTTLPFTQHGRSATPDDVIARINQCRVVVTGSYHAGVFALASGIPVVGLASTSYYLDKFRGLKQQFGPGCEVAYLDEPDAMQVLEEKVVTLWSNAGHLKQPLITRAEEQIERANAAYARVKEEVESSLIRKRTLGMLVKY